jgi:hypothetical protein
MPKKKTRLDRFSDLTWNDIEEWAGGKIVSRGKSYQRQGRVSDLAVTDDGSLIAWVDGTVRYATRKVRESLLRYLEKGELPWKQKGWPLPESVPILPSRKPSKSTNVPYYTRKPPT